MIANAKYLGVQVDSQLNWDKHVDTIKTKANEPLDLLSILRNIFHLMCSTKCTEGLSSPI